MFDDDQRVAHVEERFEAIDELYDVGEMEAGGRFVEDEERAAVAFGGEVGGELEALRFAAGERGRGLADAEVVEADVDQALELRLQLAVAAEESEGFAGGHVENFGDVEAAVFDFENLAAIAAAVALAAAHVDVGHELHVDGDVAATFASFAAAAGDVEAEGAGREVAGAGVGLLGEDFADEVEGFDRGERVRARRAADGRLVDEDHVFELAAAEELVERERRLGGDLVPLGLALERPLSFSWWSGRARAG